MSGAVTPRPHPATLPLARRAEGRRAVAALVAFGLFFFMIGLRTEQGSTGALEITTRFQTFAILVAVVFAGAFLRTLIFGRGAIPLGRAVPPSRARARSTAPAASPRPALLIFALLVPVLFYQNRYLLDLGILVLTYVMLGWGLNIVVGLAGLLDLGYVAFYAVGAYSYALLATQLRPVVLDLPAARRHLRGVLGRPARLSGAAAARRLSRHRHARVRRDHPPRAAQLAEPHRRAERHSQHPAAELLRPAVRRRRRLASPRPSASNIRRPTAWCSCST